MQAENIFRLTAYFTDILVAVIVGTFFGADSRMWIAAIAAIMAAISIVSFVVYAKKYLR